jgi:hypothetical protein
VVLRKLMIRIGGMDRSFEGYFEDKEHPEEFDKIRFGMS